MLTFKPLKAYVVDFKQACMRRALTTGPPRAGVCYGPLRPNLKDGSLTWDVWAIVAMMVEADMKPGQFLVAAGHQGNLKNMKDHCDLQSTCSGLKRVFSNTIARAETSTMETLGWVKKSVGTINFSKYNIWRPPLEQITKLIRPKAAAIAHVVVEKGAGEAREAR